MKDAKVQPFGTIENISPRRFLGMTLSGWSAFAGGWVAALLLFYVTVAQPASRLLATLQDEVGQLRLGMDKLARQKGVAQRANDLLGLLAQQKRRIAMAERSLTKMQALNRRLTQESVRAEQAVTVLESMFALTESLAQSGEGVTKASQALGSVRQIHGRLAALDKNGSGEAAKSRLERLIQFEERLAESTEAGAKAWRTADDLLAIQDELVLAGNSTDNAQAALEKLIGIRVTLDAQGGGLELAKSRVESLLSLKDLVLGRTENLADAVETMEVVNELESQFFKVADTFRRIRDWMTEILILEPMFRQAMHSLEPLTELGNLRHLSPQELRTAARQIALQREGHEGRVHAATNPLKPHLDGQPPKAAAF